MYLGETRVKMRFSCCTKRDATVVVSVPDVSPNYPRKKSSNLCYTFLVAFSVAVIILLAHLFGR